MLSVCWLASIFSQLAAYVRTVLPRQQQIARLLGLHYTAFCRGRSPAVIGPFAGAPASPLLCLSREKSLRRLVSPPLCPLAIVLLVRPLGSALARHLSFAALLRLEPPDRQVPTTTPSRLLSLPTRDPSATHAFAKLLNFLIFLNPVLFLTFFKERCHSSLIQYHRSCASPASRGSFLFFQNEQSRL